MYDILKEILLILFPSKKNDTSNIENLKNNKKIKIQINGNSECDINVKSNPKKTHSKKKSKNHSKEKSKKNSKKKTKKK